LSATGGDQSVQAAKAATATIPIVATIAFDPVESGLVVSMNRPGVSLFSNALVAKRAEMLHGTASIIGFLANPSNPSAKANAKAAEIAARALGQKIVVVNARHPVRLRDRV
jgi:putative tryptophan/tyrosine transport system substrate-binding protein